MIEIRCYRKRIKDKVAQCGVYPNKPIPPKCAEVLYFFYTMSSCHMITWFTMAVIAVLGWTLIPVYCHKNVYDVTLKVFSSVTMWCQSKSGLHYPFCYLDAIYDVTADMSVSQAVVTLVGFYDVRMAVSSWRACVLSLQYVSSFSSHLTLRAPALSFPRTPQHAVPQCS